MTRSLPRARTRLLARALLAVGLLGALVSAPASAAPVPAAVDISPPAVGSCHALTFVEVQKRTEPDRAIPCTRDHSSRTFAIVDLPDDTDMRDTETLYAAVVETCHPAWSRDVVGSTRAKRHQSLYSMAWFAPTGAQISAGARWIRCDVIVYSGRGLAPLTTDRAPAIRDGRIPDGAAKCAKGETKDFLQVVCTEGHEYRARGTFAMTGKAYPSAEKLYAAAVKRCPKVAGSRQWLVDYPSEADWANDFRLLLCYSKTSR